MKLKYLVFLTGRKMTNRHPIGRSGRIPVGCRLQNIVQKVHTADCGQITTLSGCNRPTIETDYCNIFDMPIAKN